MEHGVSDPNSILRDRFGVGLGVVYFGLVGVKGLKFASAPTNRKRGVLGKRVDLGGRRII